MPLKSHRLLCFFVLLSSAGKPLIWWMPWKYVSCFQMNFRFSSPTWCCWLCSLPLDIVRFSEKAMAPHSSTLAWKIPWTEEPGRLHGVHGVAKSWTQLSDFPFTFHFHALEKEMATHSSVLAWRIPGMGKPGGLLSTGSHRVGHDWSDLAAAAATELLVLKEGL